MRGALRRIPDFCRSQRACAFTGSTAFKFVCSLREKLVFGAAVQLSGGLEGYPRRATQESSFLSGNQRSSSDARPVPIWRASFLSSGLGPLVQRRLKSRERERIYEETCPFISGIATHTRARCRDKRNVLGLQARIMGELVQHKARTPIIYDASCARRSDDGHEPGKLPQGVTD